MKYLLDTDICIYFLNENQTVIDRMKKIPANNMLISVITLAELQFGAYNSNKIKNNLERVKFFEKSIQTITLSPEITEEYARIKSKLRKSGNTVDDFDILIGATAVVNGFILVTNNEQHFSRIDKINLENWSK